MGIYQHLSSNWTDQQRLAICSPQISYDYAQLHIRVRKCIHWLQSNHISAGDVVCIQFPKEPIMLEMILACFAIGAPVLPLNDKYTHREVDYYIKDCAAKLSCLPATSKYQNPNTKVISTSLLQEQIAQIPPATMPPSPAPDDLAILLYTSGTTGQPKGAMISHANVMAVVASLHEKWHWTPNDKLLHALPLFHVHGLFVAQLVALYANAESHWMTRFDPQRAFDIIEQRQITVFMGVPTFYHRFLQQQTTTKPNLTSMRLFTSGSAPLPRTVHQQFQQKYAHTILERYGMTEVGIVLSNPYDGPRRPGTVGFPVSGANFKIVDPHTTLAVKPQEIGELWIKGPSVIKGYLNKPQQTQETIIDGWLRSGDLAKLDSTGYYNIVGRHKDLIISGGMNIYPREIEAIFLEHPAISDVAVVGIADPEWGERVVAAVIVNQPIDVDELRGHLRQQVSGYKSPKEIRIVSEFPRNALGKIQKAKIRNNW